MVVASCWISHRPRIDLYKHCLMEDELFLTSAELILRSLYGWASSWYHQLSKLHFVVVR